MPRNGQEKTREVPSGKVFARGSLSGCALHETPPVLLKVLPIPVRQQGIKDRDHLFGSLGDFRLEARDLLLGFIALDIGFEVELSTDSLGRFGVGFILQRTLNNGLEVSDGCFGQALVNRILDLFPLGISGRSASFQNEEGHYQQGDDFNN